MSGQHFPADYVVHGITHEREVASAYLQGKRVAIKVGIAVGFALAIPVLGLLGYGVDRWRSANDAELRAAADARYRQCLEDLTAYAGLASEVAGIEVRR